MALAEQFFQLKLKQLDGLSLSLREPRLYLSIRLDRIRSDAFSAIPAQEEESGIASRVPVMDDAIPLSARMEDEAFEIFRRLFPASSPKKSGDLARPYGQYVEKHILIVERKSCIPRVERFKQPFRKRKHPLHLLTALFGAVPPAGLHSARTA